jgi:hypothetical protein
MHRSFYIPDTASPPQRSPNLFGGLVQATRDNCFSGCVEGELLQQLSKRTLKFTTDNLFHAMIHEGLDSPSTFKFQITKTYQQVVVESKTSMAATERRSAIRLGG